MSSSGDNRYKGSRRKNRGVVAALALVVVVLVAAAFFYSNDLWSGEATGTRANAPTAQVPSGAGSSAPGPNR
jgi:ABC-type phosphate transport system substrate-binding protein